MKNIINYPIDFSKIENSEKIYMYIDDDLLLDLKSKNSSEKLVEIKNNEIKTAPFWNDEIIYTGDEQIDILLNMESDEMKKYLEKNNNFGIFVREGVKKRLLDVNNYLKEKGYEIVLKIGYRPFEVQEKLFNEIYKYFEDTTNLKGEELYKQVTEFIADPNKYIAPHTTGGAVDLILLDKDGKKVDMGCEINFVGEKSNLTTNDITEEQRKNREFLAFTMLKFGFANLASEWWHFSYGDPYWAFFYGEKQYLYNTVKSI